MAAATPRHQRVAVGLQVQVLVSLALPHTATAKIAAAGELAVRRGVRPLRYHGSVRLLILTARPELAANSRLCEAAEAEGVEPVVLDAARVVAVCGEAPHLLCDGADLLDDPPGAVIARVGNWRPRSVLAALEASVDAGVATPNPPGAIRTGRDHWLTVRGLGLAGLPVLETLAGSDPETVAQAAHDRLGYPVVVKQRRSRMGVGVIRCDGRDQLEAVLDTLWRLGDEYIVQRYLPAGNSSLRLLVVGGVVVAGARFTAGPGEWRSNAARGGDIAKHRPSDGETRLAVSAAAALGLGHCGVDLLPGSSPVVLEVNPTPGFSHLERATGEDVARAIVAHAVGAGTRG